MRITQQLLKFEVDLSHQLVHSGDVDHYGEINL